MLGFKSKLKDLQLHKKENKYGVEYYLTAVYEDDRKDGIYESTIPHIVLPISENLLSMEYGCGVHLEDTMQIDLGFGSLKVRYVSDKPKGPKYLYKTVKIEDKTQKMTLSEIEDKHEIIIPENYKEEYIEHDKKIKSLVKEFKLI